MVGTNLLKYLVEVAIELADYTGGRVFDALDGDLNEVFKEIRAYQ